MSRTGIAYTLAGAAGLALAAVLATAPSSGSAAFAQVADVVQAPDVASSIVYRLPSGWDVSDMGLDYLYLGGDREDRQQPNGTTYTPAIGYISIQARLWTPEDSELQGVAEYGVSGGEITSGETVISGRPATYTQWDYDYWASEPAGMAGGQRQRRQAFWVPVEGGGYFILTTARADGPGSMGREQLDADYQEMASQVDQIMASLELPDIPTDGSAVAPAQPRGGSPWRTVFGTLGAVAAAAAAMAGAFASTAAGRAQAKRNPRMVIGYVLQVSERSVTPQLGASAPLSVTAWRVRASGEYEPATDAIITLAPPAGVSIDPSGGTGSVNARVWRPDGAAPPTPSSAISITVTGPGGGTSASVAIGGPPALEVDPDRIDVVVGSGTRSQVKSWVAGPAGKQWSINASWQDPTTAPATVEIASDPATSSATITLAERAIAGSGSATEDATSGGVDAACGGAHTLLVRAQAPGAEPLERCVTYVAASEGLFVDPIPRHPDGTFHVLADGKAKPKAVYFRVMVLDPATRRLVSDPQAAAQLRFAPVAEPGTPERNILDFAQLSQKFAGMTAEKPPQGCWNFSVAKDVPGENPGDAYPVTIRASVPGRDPEKFALDFKLGLVLSDSPTPAELIELERKRAQHVIDTLAPPALAPRLQQLLDTQSPRLGPEGMADLRKQIWQHAADAVLAEGANALETAKYYDWVVYFLDNWVIWAGDLAFGALVGSYFGPQMAMGVTVVKPMIVSALAALVEGKTPEAWAREQVWSILYLFEGRAIDIDTFSRLSGASRTTCWAAFCVYHFFKSLYQQKKRSIVQAIKDTAWQVSDAMIAEWLGKQVRAEMQARGIVEQPVGTPPPDDEAAARKAEEDAQRASRAADDADGSARPANPEAEARGRALADEIARQPVGENGRPIVDMDMVTRIMADPDAARELRRLNPDAWRAYTDSRASISASHDPALAKWISENVPDAAGRNIEVRTVGTEGGVDRDYRAGYVEIDPKTGQPQFIEIPKEKWVGESQRLLAEATGGPTDPAGAAEHARRLQWLATDQHHSQAAVDMADQGTRLNEKTGQWEPVQMTPNVELVKQGHSTLLDADGLGRTYETKVADSYHDGHIGDAYSQAGKAVHSLEGCRAGYEAQGYKVTELPPDVRAGMQIVSDVAEGRIKPAEGEAFLRGMEYSGLTDFMQRISGHFGALGHARKE